MLRLAWLILLMSATAAGIVYARLQQNAVITQAQKLEAERLRVRRLLWDQQIRLGELAVPEEIRRGDEWSAQAAEYKPPRTDRPGAPAGPPVRPPRSGERAERPERSSPTPARRGTSPGRGELD